MCVDHNSLISLISNHQKDTPAQMVRWNKILTEYTFSVIHLSGKHNYIPDLLSRLEQATPVYSPETHTYGPEDDSDILGRVNEPISRPNNVQDLT